MTMRTSILDLQPLLSAGSRLFGRRGVHGHVYVDGKRVFGHPIHALLVGRVRDNFHFRFGAR